MSRKPLQARAQFFDPSQKGPPPQGGRGDWSLELDDGSFARPPVPVNFLGTIVHEKPDPRSAKSVRDARAAQIERRIEHNETTLEQAIFILSQSPTGRDVLEQMTKEGYRIVFDDRRTGDRGAGGLCDPTDKLIILKAHDDPEYLALLIGHESVHAVQNTRHDLFPSTKHKPEAGIRLSFAIEADAYAQQTQIALELAYGDFEGPVDQVRFNGPLRQMRLRFPDIVKAAERVMSHEDALKNGKCVTAAFLAFYDNFHLRTFYEDSHIEWANMYAPKLKGSFPWLQRHFSKDVESDWILERIHHRGQPYLKLHAPTLDFNDLRHAGVTSESAQRIDKFYNDHLPGQKRRPLKIFGVHMQDAVSVVLGLTNHVRAIFKAGAAPPPKPPKPPLRAAPRRKWGFWE